VLSRLRLLRLSLFPDTQRYTLGIPGDWPGCNPSIAKDGDGFRVIVRTINYRLLENGHWSFHPHGGARTINWLLRLDRNLQTISANRIDDQNIVANDARAANGLEDGRLFYWRNDWWFSASAVRFVIDSTYPTTCICRLDAADAVTEAHFIPSSFGQVKEKNWMPVIAGGELKLIYRISPLQIVDVANDWSTSIRSLEERRARIDGWAGSSQLVEYGGNWICVVHKRFEKMRRVYYQHAFVELSRDFRILRVSQPWFFDKPTVEFCAGLCPADGSAILSYGSMDREAHLLKIPLTIVEDLLEDSWRSRRALRAAYRRGWKNQR
jgi:hypothetical protein